MRRQIAILGVLIAVLSVTSSHVIAQRGMTRVAGVVVEEGGSAGAIGGVQIQAKYNGSSIFDTSSDDKGSWAIGGMGKGDWNIVFEKPGYVTRSVKLFLPVDLSRVPKITVAMKKGST